MIEIKFKTFFILLIIIGFLTTIFFLITQSSIFFKQEGTNVTIQDSFIMTDDEKIGAILVLARDKDTPQAYDWVSGDKYAVFSVDDVENKRSKVQIKFFILWSFKSYIHVCQMANSL